LAAFMSTIDTHTNWGASYLVQDVYKRFLRPDATEREAVAISRFAILLMALLAGITALFVQNIASVWVFIINLGAGLGSVTAARWYWSRVTPQAEFAALGVTTVLALGLLLFATPTLFGGPNPLFLYEIPGWVQILVIAGGSLASWVPVALFGPRNDPEVLRSFAALVRPGGPGWAAWRSEPGDPILPAALRVLAGLVVVYGALFGIGDWVLGRWGRGAGLLLLAALALVWIARSGRARTQG
jgi:SSS family solute:Na+ symporter